MPGVRAIRFVAVCLCVVAAITAGAMAAAGDDPWGPRGDGTLRGGDLVAFWVGGSVLAEEPPHALYKRGLATTHQRRLNPEQRVGYRLGYPPPIFQVARAFVPLGFPVAVRAWIVLLALVTALGCAAMARAAPGVGVEPWVAAALIFASPSGLILLGTGQASGLWMLSLGVGMLLLSRGNHVAAGVALGLLVAKPSIALPVVVALALTGRGRALLGFGIGAALLVGASIAADGVGPWAAWLAAQEDPAEFARRMWNFPHRQLTFRSALGLPFPRRSAEAGVAGWIGVGLGALLVLATAAAGRGERGRDDVRAALGFGAILSAGLLATPHLFDYDVVLHAPGWLASAAWLRSGRARRPQAGAALLCGAWLAPAMQEVVAVTQVAVGVALVAAWVVWMASELAGSRPDRA